jgi:hypothetical protein
MQETFLSLLTLLLDIIREGLYAAPLNYYDSVLLYSNWGRKRPGKWRMALDCIAGGMAMAVGLRLLSAVIFRVIIRGEGELGGVIIRRAPAILPVLLELTSGILIGAILYTVLHWKTIREEWKLDPAYTLGFVLSMGFAFSINYVLLYGLETIAAILRYQVRAKGYLTP